MKKVLSLAVPVLSSIFVGLTSFSVEAKPDCGAMTPRPYVEPSTLANMAYRGTFKEQGIPSYTTLMTQVGSGKISGQAIVDAAVEACYLSGEYGMNKNPNFARDVEQTLKSIYQGN